MRRHHEVWVPPVGMNAPIAIQYNDLNEQPASRAWRGLGAGPEPTAVELWRKLRTKPAVFRLTFADGSHPAVFAKQCPAADLAFERRIYEEILPLLPVTTPRYHGFHAGPDGYGWLFVEDVGGSRISVTDPTHRALAGRWLGTLHRAAANVIAVTQLPEGGPPRYLGYLRTSRAFIREHLGNPVLRAADVEHLRSVLQWQDVLEARWPALESALANVPRTLVHGDFRPKNARVHPQAGAATLFVIDWEMAGFGIPAADLAPARNLGVTPLVDPDAYEGAVREDWPEFDRAMFEHLTVAGKLFRALAAIDWDSQSLRFESYDNLVQAVSGMPYYVREISQALEAGAEWLR